MALQNALFAQLFPFRKSKDQIDILPVNRLDGNIGGNPTTPVQYQPPLSTGEQEARAPLSPTDLGPMPTPSFIQAPGYDAQGQPNMQAPVPPKFGQPNIDPNASQMEQAQKMLDYWNGVRDNPVNQDKGWKGLIKELAENFAFGLSKAQPGMNVAQALSLGATGAGAGFFNKGWNEQRRAEQEIPIAQERLDNATNQQAKEAQIVNAEARPEQVRLERERKAAKDDITRQYNEDRVRLGKEKADDIKFYRERVLDLQERGYDQKDKQLVQAQQRLNELMRHNKATEGQAQVNERGRQVRFDTAERSKALASQAKDKQQVVKDIEKIKADGRASFIDDAEIEKAVQSYLSNVAPELRP